MEFLNYKNSKGSFIAPLIKEGMIELINQNEVLILIIIGGIVGASFLHDRKETLAFKVDVMLIVLGNLILVLKTLPPYINNILLKYSNFIILP